MLNEYKKSWLDTFDYKGRMTKEAWGKAMGMHLLITIVPAGVFVFLDWETVGAVWGFLISISAFPMLSCLVRRMHDVGKSGWWLLLYLVLAQVLIGWILFILQMDKKSAPANQWGTPKTEEEGRTPDAFVDETLTEADVKSENKRLVLTILKIIGILAVIFFIIELCAVFL